MTNISVTKPYQKRRRYSKELKARIVAECLKPGASVSRISLDNGLNANMAHRWMKRVRVPLSYPAPDDFDGGSGSLPGGQISRGMGGRLRLESVATVVWNTQWSGQRSSARPSPGL